MFDKMKQLMEMKRQADELKRQLDDITVESQVVTGIKITVNGSQTFKTIEVDPTHLRPENKSRFEQDLLKSVNAAVQKSQQTAAQKMRQVMPNIPGLT